MQVRYASQQLGRGDAQAPRDPHDGGQPRVRDIAALVAGELLGAHPGPDGGLPLGEPTLDTRLTDRAP
jgi:hypothetical protein